MRWWVGLVLVVVGGACMFGPEPQMPGADAGTSMDAGSSIDAGEVVDAGEGSDAGDVVDAGEAVDAGNGADAGPGLDAGALGPVRAWLFSPMPLTIPATCFRSGSTAPRTFTGQPLTLLVWEAADAGFVAVEPRRARPEYSFGDAPSAFLPVGVRRGATDYETSRTDSVGWPSGGRGNSTTAIRLSLAADRTSATLTFDLNYACVAQGTQTCAPAAQTPTSCLVDLPGVLTAIPVDPTWLQRPSGVSTPNAERFLVAIDEVPRLSIGDGFSQYDQLSCYRNGNRMPRQLVNVSGVVDVQVWEVVSGSSVLMDRVPVRLGDAPAIEWRSTTMLEASTGDVFDEQTITTPVVTYYTELRRTRVAVGGVSMASPAPASVRLESQFSCIDGQSPCPTGDAIQVDAAQCTVTSRVWAVRVN